jgi:hypothetical protein
VSVLRDGKTFKLKIPILVTKNIWFAITFYQENDADETSRKHTLASDLIDRYISHGGRADGVGGKRARELKTKQDNCKLTKVTISPMSNLVEFAFFVYLDDVINYTR